jgi:hypothetical protein
MNLELELGGPFVKRKDRILGEKQRAGILRAFT